MEFWRLQPDAAPAVIDARTQRQWTYAELRRDADLIRAALPVLGRKSLGAVVAHNCYECLAAYLAALHADSAVILLDAGLNAELLRVLIEVYKPDWIFAKQSEVDFSDAYGRNTAVDFGLLQRKKPEDLEIHAAAKLLLSTSGSTGSPKLVRLSLKNLEANADSIAKYLGLTPEERPITSLPMPYSYGLSVINSHLQAGAAIVFSDASVLRREFWEAVERHGCTSLSGVPYTYQILLQSGLLASKKGPSLRTFTQAGGKLDDRFILKMRELAQEREWKFFVMYGQTEATARISYVPAERLDHKIGSVGVAVPGGSLQLDRQTGELIYTGPNVMLGYATCREDLALGDELQGVLRTGDLARQDADGYFYITGRMKRFLKLFGKRFNLDEVESVLSHRFDLALACVGRDDLLTLVLEKSENTETIGQAVSQIFNLPRTSIRIIAVSKLPRTINGKIDYPRLPDGPEESKLAASSHF